MTQKWTTLDTWARFFICELMKRRDENGYNDEAAIREGFRLANFTMKIRKGIKKPKPECEKESGK